MTFDSRAKHAIATAKNGDYEHAKSVVIDLISEDYQNAQAHRAWGRVLLEEGKVSDAVAAYRVAVTLDNESPYLLFEFAESLLIQRQRFAHVPLPNWIEAREAVDTGLSLAPGDPKGLRLREQIARNLEVSAV